MTVLISALRRLYAANRVKDFKVDEYHIGINKREYSDQILVKVVKVDPTGFVYVKAARTLDELDQSPVYKCKVQKDKDKFERDYVYNKVTGNETEVKKYKQKIAFKFDGATYEADYEVVDIKYLKKYYPEFF